MQSVCGILIHSNGKANISFKNLTKDWLLGVMPKFIATSSYKNNSLFVFFS